MSWAPDRWRWWRSEPVWAGFPLAEAARIEAEELRRHLQRGSGLERVVFAVRGEEARSAFEAALEASGLDSTDPR